MDIKTIAKTISLIEDNSIQKKTILSKLYSQTGSAHRIGITGPPGAGKSSLINLLIEKIRSKDKKVAVICIDPTSPFSLVEQFLEIEFECSNITAILMFILEVWQVGMPLEDYR